MKRYKILLSSTLIAIFVIGITGCGDSSTTSSGSGSSKLSQTVVEGNITKSSFCGGLEDISVSIVSRSTATDKGGRFQLNAVPAGAQNVVFSKCNERATMRLTISAGQTLTLSNVRVGRNAASGTQDQSPSRPTPTPTAPSPDGDSTDDRSNDDDQSDDDD